MAGKMKKHSRLVGRHQTRMTREQNLEHNSAIALHILKAECNVDSGKVMANLEEQRKVDHRRRLVKPPPQRGV